MNLESLPPRILGWLDRNFLCKVRTAAPLLALTFDDGPDAENTPRVLEALARGGHTATFFCIGRNAARHPGIVAGAAAAGHEIANHTFSHPPLTLVSHRRLLEEVRRADWVLASIAGRTPVHFRPPMGWATPAILRAVEEEGYRSVLGTIYPADPRAPDAATIVERTLPRLAPGRILILHDGGRPARPRTRTLEALPLILAQLEARGLRGVSVRQLLESVGGGDSGSGESGLVSPSRVTAAPVPGTR